MEISFYEIVCIHPGGAMQEMTDTLRLLPYMPLVQHYDRRLGELGDWWQKITLIGKINSQNVTAALLDDMESIRFKFKELHNKLVSSLVHENLYKNEQEIAARSQVAIDILIRNLFERTADVGFLATDDDLRAYLLNPAPTEADYAEAVERLREYTLKYSVYDEIIVTDPQGRVRVHLDQDNPVEHVHDPLLAETLNTSEAYVETFRHTDLQPARRYSLVYSCRIHESNEPGSRVLGVLCLCFRFQNEMDGIFAKLARKGELLAILDRDARVIASSSEALLPLGTKVSTAQQGRAQLEIHTGQEYLVKTAATNGYQGYFGSGWLGHVMVPTAGAFHLDEGENLPDAQFADASFISQNLRTISRAAAVVTDDLILMVINGQIVSARKDAKEFMPILDEVRSIGHETRKAFDASIQSLHHTVLTSLLSDVRFQAGLAVDIMDRNLYERANDARWWALTTRFREILAQPERIAAQQETLGAILEYINGLYTVYTNLFLYDTHGVVVAVSNPGEQHLLGHTLTGDGQVQAVLGLTNSQQYKVSPFHKTPLYGDRPTYVYHAAIRVPGDTGRRVGGIGIVFDAEPQFQAMLHDALPRDDAGHVPEGCFGAFVEPDGRVVSSTSEQLPPGAHIELDKRFFELEHGKSISAITEYAGRPYAVGAAMSQGYREYKTTKDYDNDIVALIFMAL